MSQIVTGDAVVLDLRPARVPTRMLAALVDLVVVALLTWVWSYVLYLFRHSWAEFDAAQTAGTLLCWFGYLIGVETLLRGRTLGHLALGLRVVRDDGGFTGFRHALVRGLAFWLVDFAPYTGCILGLVAASLHPQGKRLGDVMAGTLVIRTRPPRTTRPLPPAKEDVAAWARGLEMSRISDEQVAAARYALQRSHLLRPAYRKVLVDNLARQLGGLVAPRPPATLPTEDFLAVVVAEHARRAEAPVTADVGVDVPSAWR